MVSRGRGGRGQGRGFVHNGPRMQQPTPQPAETAAQQEPNGNPEVGQEFSPPPATPSTPVPVAREGGGFVPQSPPRTQQPSADVETAQEERPQPSVHPTASEIGHNPSDGHHQSSKEAEATPQPPAQQELNGNSEAGKEFSTPFTAPPATTFNAPRGGGGRGRGARGRGGFVPQGGPPAQPPIQHAPAQQSTAENEAAQQEGPQQNTRPATSGRGGGRGRSGGDGFRQQGGSSTEGPAGQQEGPSHGSGSNNVPLGDGAEGGCKYCKKPDHTVENCPDLKCHKCHEQGHKSRECKNERVESGCKYCKEPEHTVDVCPRLKCRRCGEQGHKSCDCTNPPVEREKQPFTGECHNCQQSGHRAAECPAPRVYHCFNCTESGHISRDCPTRPGNEKKPPTARPEGPQKEEFVPEVREVDVIFHEDDQQRESYSQIADQDDELRVEEANGQAVALPVKLDNWRDTNFDAILLKNIDRSNYVLPRKIQQFAIPAIMEGRDLIAQSETGSGKSAAFLIPLIQKIKPKVGGKKDVEMDRPFAIVVEPTRELVVQVYEQARKLAHETGVRVVKAYGQYSFGQNSEEVFGGCDLLIATPGRLLHFITSHVVNTGALEHLVLDEADRLLDEKFVADIDQLMSCIQQTAMAEKKAPQPLQVMLFSATMPERLEAFGGNVLRPDHVVIRNRRHDMPNLRIEQTFESVVGEDKKHLMVAFCQRVVEECVQKGKARQAANAAAAEDANDSVSSDAEIVAKEAEEKQKAVKQEMLEKPRILIFCGSKAKADAFAFYVNALKKPHMDALSVNSDRSQKDRELALSQFRKGDTSLLFTTDVCARGLDIKELDYVLNFDMPKDLPTYVQRIGRTGRLRRGFAHSYLDPVEDEGITRQLVQMLRREGRCVPPFMEAPPPPRFAPPAALTPPITPTNMRPFGNVGFQPAAPQPAAVQPAQPQEPAAGFLPDEVVAAPPVFSGDEDDGDAGGFGRM